MKILWFSFLLILPCFFEYQQHNNNPVSVTTVTDTIPDIIGKFTDDYGVVYTISDSLWTQQPGIKYHILKWNKHEQYIIARNDHKNPSEPGLYTRIDYMKLENMLPWTWGFCYTAYAAKTDSIAEHAEPADRDNPKKGCGGYPFSRMKKID